LHNHQLPGQPLTSPPSECSHLLSRMSPPPLHVSNYNSRFSHNNENFRDSGWGIHAGRLPMYSPVWTNDKSWVQRISDQFTSALAEFPNILAESLPFTRRSARSFATGRPSMSASTSSSNFLFILLCSLWYTTSALSSNTGKAILNQFRYPITLTFVQFGFIAFYCLLSVSPVIRFSKLRHPTKAILQNTLPMGMFQVGGHIFSSIAISRIPVSTVHTIKVSTSKNHHLSEL
jgi:solute carrier family 35 protein E1